MKKKNLTEEELDKLKQLQQRKQLIKDSIFMDTEALTPKQLKKLMSKKR